MNYNVLGSTNPAVEIRLERGESVYTQTGGMAWKTPGVGMKTNTNGGIMKGLGRMLVGESLFMTTFTGQGEDNVVAFSSTVPGCIVPVNMQEYQGVIFQKGAFLCAQSSVECKIELTKKFSAGLFGGEGFILQSASGSGTLFLEVDGDKMERTLAPGEVLEVDTGNVVAFEKTVRYEVEMVKGLSNIFLGGEGLFLTRLTGPGKVIIQTLNFQDFAGRVINLMPKNNR